MSHGFLLCFCGQEKKGTIPALPDKVGLVRLDDIVRTHGSVQALEIISGGAFMDV